VDDITLTGRMKAKLIETKQLWARQGRLLTGTTADPAEQRLPPGQTLVRDWPVLDLGVQPDVPLAKWSLRIDGAVANPVQLDWEGFMALPQVETKNDIHCVTQWSRYDNTWHGVQAQHLLAMALERQHGGPVRVVLPRLYFWKSPKWVSRIELLEEDRPGFWEVRGYHNNGDPWLEERYG